MVFCGEPTSSFIAEQLYYLNSAMQVPAGFDMHRQIIAPCLDKRWQEHVRLLDHEVDIERQIRHCVEGFDDRRPDGEIGHKVPVHDINVNQVSASGFDPADLFSQAGKISGEDRWCDLCHRLVLIMVRPYGESGPRILPRCPTVLASSQECRCSPQSLEAELKPHGQWHQAAYRDV